MTKKKKKNYWEEAKEEEEEEEEEEEDEGRQEQQEQQQELTTKKQQQHSDSKLQEPNKLGVCEHVRCRWAFTPFKNGFICWTDLWTWSDCLWSQSISKCNYGSGFQQQFSISYLRMEDFSWISYECLLKENGPLIPIPA